MNFKQILSQVYINANTVPFCDYVESRLPFA